MVSLRGFPVVVLTASVAACAGNAGSPPVMGQPGDPLPGLSQEQAARFAQGRAMFEHEFTPREGLGPLFNQARCSSCHDVPVLGGSGTELVRKATRYVDGRCDLLEAEGGDNLQQRTTEALRAHGFVREDPPPDATHVTDMTAPALFGLGLAEAIPDETLAALADPDDEDGDGISGRMGRTLDGRPARFGQKADAATVREFVAGALLQEMGLTTSMHDAELNMDGSTLPLELDSVPDPEVPDAALDLITDFVRFLVPPAPLPPDDAADSAQVERGRTLFTDIGCTGCHTPILDTGPQPDSVFAKRTVALYSDFLLHDMGSENADVCGPGAGPSEVRTARLAGLRLRPVLLHHGRAGNLRQVLDSHGGEAAASRQSFRDLSPLDRAALLRFLETL